MPLARNPPGVQAPCPSAARTPVAQRVRLSMADDDLFSERGVRLTDGSDSSVMMHDDDTFTGPGRAASANTSGLSDVFATAAGESPRGCEAGAREGSP